MTSWADGLPRVAVAPAEVRGRHAVGFAAIYPERSSRLRTLFRAVLVVPAWIVAALFIWIAQMLASVAWLVIVFSGQYDQTLWRFSLGCLRRMAILSCYLSLLRDEYPPFGEGRYPLTFEIGYAYRRSRLSAFFRLLLVVPQLVVLSFLALPWTAAVAIAWFAILVTGRYPRGIWLLVEGFNRWNMRVQAYMLLLTDEFPPYSLDVADSATPPDDTASAPPVLVESVPPIAGPELGFVPPYVPPLAAAADNVAGPGFFAWPPRPSAEAEADEPDRPARDF